MFPICKLGEYTSFTPSVPQFYQNAYSSEEALKKILFELGRLAAYANDLADAINDRRDFERLELRVARLEEWANNVRDALDALVNGGRARNPMSGMFDFLYIILKQMYDTLRTHAMTWRQLAATGRTWAELAGDSKTYIEVDMLSNDIWGDGTELIKYTSPNRIDVNTPGFYEEVHINGN